MFRVKIVDVVQGSMHSCVPGHLLTAYVGDWFWGVNRLDESLCRHNASMFAPCPCSSMVHARVLYANYPV